MSDVMDLLARLSGVKSVGEDRWIAKCPAHDDRVPSLSIALTPDHWILAKCFAGCHIEAICSAVGLHVGDLFPDAIKDHSAPRLKAPFSPMQALLCLRREASVVAIAASDIADGKALSDEDADRIVLAAGRIAEAMEAVHAAG